MSSLIQRLSAAAAALRRRGTLTIVAGPSKLFKIRALCSDVARVMWDVQNTERGRNGISRKCLGDQSATRVNDATIE